MDIDTVLEHYLVAAVWADMPEDDNNIDHHAEISDESKELARTDIMQFIGLAGELIQQFESCEFGQWPAPEMLGHDIWLTRNGHGVGFWDRENLPGDLGEKLTAIAEEIGERSIYRGDDSRVYID